MRRPNSVLRSRKVWRLPCVCLVALLLTWHADDSLANVVSINIGFDLREASIYNCGGEGPPAAYPDGALCWTTGAISIAPVTVDPEDVIRIKLNFAGPYGLEWADDGIGGVEPYFDEFVQVSARYSGGSFGYNNGTVSNTLTFASPRGDLLVNDLAWTFEGSMGGPVSQAYANFTDSAFQFFGITSTIGPFVGSTGLPPTIDTIHVHLGTGQFSIVRVPEPYSLALVTGGLLGIFLVRRKRALLTLSR